MSPIEFVILLVIFAAAALWLRCKIFISVVGHKKSPPPPGPKGLPLIGHLHMLGQFPNRTLHKLSQKYGPIMSLRLGSVPTIVVSSSAAAELFLKTHDNVFASRPNSQAAEYVMYGAKGITFTKYGKYWRDVRKFCMMELLSGSKISSMAELRRDELGFLVESLKKAARAHEVVDVNESVARLIENITFRMFFGKSKDDRFDLIANIHEMAVVFGAFNIADYIPILGALDLQGINRRIKSLHKALDEFLDIIIDEHERDASNSHKKLGGRDFVDVILSLKNNPATSTEEGFAQNMDRSHVKAIVVDLIFGAIDTSLTAIEWTMTELIRHPRVMKLLQQELRDVIGDGEVVQESDFPKLEYLDMVVKESVRLHPVVPLLVPRESMEDIVVNGHYIKKKSRIIINYWSISRDPKIWSENVEEFIPERFKGSNIDLLGHSYEVIPFGSGRRSCPGMNLGIINVKLVVAQLVHSFNWKLPFGKSPDELDMDEIFSIALPRANHLLAIPSLRI